MHHLFPKLTPEVIRIPLLTLLSSAGGQSARLRQGDADHSNWQEATFLEILRQTRPQFADMYGLGHYGVCGAVSSGLSEEVPETVYLLHQFRS